MKDLIAALRDYGHSRSYAKGEFLFHAHDPARGFFYIIKGEIRIYQMDDQGREVEVIRLGAGEFLGEALYFTGGSYPQFAQAALDSRVLYFPGESIERQLKTDPSVARLCLKLLARKCIVLNKRIEALGLMTVRKRLIRFLLSRCGGEGNCVIELTIKKSDLAKALGTVSETLSRNFKHLQDDGLIQVQGKKILVRDCCRMRSEIS